MSTFSQSGNEGGSRVPIVTRPPHFPTMHTRETVTHLAAFGLDENQIAVIIKCTLDDVRLHYSEELEHGLARINARVMSAVLHAALYQDSAQDRKLWLVNKASWRSGDGNKTAILNAPGASADGETMTVVQRREVITKMLVRATQAKRQQERVIEGEVVPAKKNGNGTNGANGHGGGSGVKHR